MTCMTSKGAMAWDPAAGAWRLAPPEVRLRLWRKQTRWQQCESRSVRCRRPDTDTMPGTSVNLYARDARFPCLRAGPCSLPWSQRWPRGFGVQRWTRADSQRPPSRCVVKTEPYFCMCGAPIVMRFRTLKADQCRQYLQKAARIFLHCSLHPSDTIVAAWQGTLPSL